ncbi:hypothetical protein B0H13DRAFT_1879669 [Mycena leptocephala]|nr:hypothetical protein B0H13DRAFT_1879669 [Mycena leptocephala]
MRGGGQYSCQNLHQAVGRAPRRTAQKYRVAHAALTVLGPRLNETDWKTQLRPLAHNDVRQRPRRTFADANHHLRTKKRKMLEEIEVEARKKKLEESPASWIWLMLLSEEEDAETGMTEAMRIEWARTRARAWRWTEEVDLLEEGMHRVLEFLKWRAGWWMSLVDQWPEVVEDIMLQEGFAAYARHQSQLQLDHEGHSYYCVYRGGVVCLKCIFSFILVATYTVLYNVLPVFIYVHFSVFLWGKKPNTRVKVVLIVGDDDGAP